MNDKFYIDVDDFAQFISEELPKKIPNTALTCRLVNLILDYVEDKMEHKEFCPYGFTEIDMDVCDACKVSK